jgi:O-acetylhomoserine/O-acetylserine sulfhydrylase-like pyridoxal-dependent enzyme
MKFDTESIHAGRKPDPTTGAIVTPLCQTSTFVFEDVGKTKAVFSEDERPEYDRGRYSKQPDWKKTF